MEQSFNLLCWLSFSLFSCLSSFVSLNLEGRGGEGGGWNVQVRGDKGKAMADLC